MIPALLTAAVAALAPAEIGQDYGPDVGQTVQTVVIPDGSRWKVVWTLGEDGKPDGCDSRVTFRGDMMVITAITDRGPINFSGSYRVEATAGSPRFHFWDRDGTICSAGPDRFVIQFPRDTPLRILYVDFGRTVILVREKP